MGLQSDVGFSPVTRNGLQRLLQRAGATGLGTALFSRALSPLDSLAHKLSKGRRTVGRSFGGLPVVMLTTVGARTGQRRTTPLNAIPFDEDLALIGTNYGRGTTPAWAHNLRTNSRAVLDHRGRECPVVATEVHGARYEAAFAAAIRVYPGYARYRRIAVNEIPVFILSSEGKT